MPGMILTSGQVLAARYALLRRLGDGRTAEVWLARDRGDRTDRVLRKAYETGLILVGAGTYGNIIRTLMPLVVTDGQLEVQFGRKRRLLQPGDSFGGQSHSTRKAVRATTRVRLLVLDALEAKWLLTSLPDFSDRITEAA